MSRLTSITRRAALAAALIALGARDAAAQWNVARFDGARNRVYTSYGLDPAFVGTVGYGRIVPVKGHPFQLTADAGVATAKLDANDWRTRIGVQTSLLRWRSVQLTGSATSITRGTENSIYRAIDFGADLTGAVGVYHRRWFAAGEFGKDKAIATHLTHSDWYRKYHYADAKDGWYVDTGGNFHYGLTTGISVGRAEVAGRFGWRRTERWDEVAPGMYGGIGVGVGF